MFFTDLIKYDYKYSNFTKEIRTRTMFWKGCFHFWQTRMNWKWLLSISYQVPSKHAGDIYYLVRNVWKMRNVGCWVEGPISHNNKPQLCQHNFGGEKERGHSRKGVWKINENWNRGKVNLFLYKTGFVVLYGEHERKVVPNECKTCILTWHFWVLFVILSTIKQLGFTPKLGLKRLRFTRFDTKLV